MRSSPPKPTGTCSPVIVLNTVVLPDPANPTRPIFIYGRDAPAAADGRRRGFWKNGPGNFAGAARLLQSSAEGVGVRPRDRGSHQRGRPREDQAGADHPE